MSTFRKKPVTIQAFLFTGGPEQTEDPAFIVDAIKEGTVKVVDGVILIDTLEGVMTGSPGDYIIQGVEGEIYPCKPDIFHKTYDPVD